MIALVTTLPDLLQCVSSVPWGPWDPGRLRVARPGNWVKDWLKLGCVTDQWLMMVSGDRIFVGL